MKKLLLFLACTVVHSAFPFIIINKTNFQVKVTFKYTSMVCRDDSRILAPGASTGDINIGLCLLSEVGAITQGPDIRMNKISGLMQPNNTTVEIMTHPIDRDSLVISVIDGNGIVVKRTANDPANAVRVPQAVRVM